MSSFLYRHCISLNPTYTVSLTVASWPTHALRDIFVRVSLINSPVEQKFKGLHKIRDYKCGNSLWHTHNFKGSEVPNIFSDITVGIGMPYAINFQIFFPHFNESMITWGYVIFFNYLTLP